MSRRKRDQVSLRSIQERFIAIIDAKFDGNQRALARLAGISTSTINNVVSGTNGMGYEFLVALARIGINIHWLLVGENPLPVSDCDTVYDPLFVRMSRLEARIATLENKLEKE